MPLSSTSERKSSASKTSGVTLVFVSKSLDDALVSAAFGGDLNHVESLLGRGASPDATTDGTTAVYAAALRDDPRTVRILLESGADPDLEGGAGSDGTPLCGAASWGFLGVVEELLKNGADPNRREDEGTGFSPLLWASRGGHVDTVRLLLAAGADPSLSVDGTTPLHAAAERGSALVCQLLVEHGADPAAVDDQGRSPLDVAQTWIAADVETVLLAQVEPQAGEVVKCTRTALLDGTELITVEVSTGDGGGRVVERESGHQQIAVLLQGRHGNLESTSD